MSTSHVHHLWVLKSIAGVPSWCKHPASSDELHEVDAQMVYHSKNHIDNVLQYAIVSVYPNDAVKATIVRHYFDTHARPMDSELPSHFTVFRVHINWHMTQEAEAQAALDEATDPLPTRQPRT